MAFESPIEEKMSAILDELKIPYQTQVEVGEQRFGGKCRFSGYCHCKENENGWDPYEDEAYDYDEDEISRWRREQDRLPECFSANDCRWCSPIKIFTLYRLDFAIEIGKHKIAIECDGYDYHRRYVKQIESDAQRDKWLRDNGWLVKRYSGSFIVGHRSKVKREIQDVLDNLKKQNEPKQSSLF